MQGYNYFQIGWSQTQSDKTPFSQLTLLFIEGLEESMNHSVFSIPFKRALQLTLLLTILLFNFGPRSTRIAYAAPPTNDNFAAPTVIGSIPYSNSINTLEATVEPNDPQVNVLCDGKLLKKGQSTVWYRYTPAVTETIFLDTIGSSYDTYIAVWTGASGSLVLTGCDDDNFYGLQSEMRLNVTAGTTYHIEVAAYDGVQGESFATSLKPNAELNAQSGGTLQFHVNYSNTDVTIGGVLKGKYYLPAGQGTSARYGINGGPVHVVNTNNQPIFTSQRTIFGSSFNSIVGYPGDQLTTDYWFTSYDDVGMITFLVIGNPHATLTAQVDVYIGGIKRNTVPYSIAPGQRIFPRYGINAGPVHVVSTNGVDIFTSERTKFGDSFNEVMGFPGNQVTTEYWFTSYDDVGMLTYLVIGNPHPSNTALVDVYIGGVKRNATPYSIAPGQRLFPRYAINAGPVRVVSTNGVAIFTSERTKFGNSFNEVMGYPGNQLSTTYWFTTLDDASMITYLVIGNPHPSNTALVDVYVSGVKKNPAPYSIAPGQRLFPRYGIVGGPVRVVSTNGVEIFTSERSKYLSSFNEILGIANNQLATDYWFTSYDDFGMISSLVISAP